VVSKLRIAFKGKAPPDEKAPQIENVMRMVKMAATPPKVGRWAFDTSFTVR